MPRQNFTKSLLNRILIILLLTCASCEPESIAISQNENLINVSETPSTLTSLTSTKVFTPIPTLNKPPTPNPIPTQSKTTQAASTEASATSLPTDGKDNQPENYALPTSVDLGDLDNDGDLDAFITYTGNIVSSATSEVWLNDGTGNFRDSGQNLGDTWSMGVDLGDLDGDGDLDALVANYLGEFNSVWLNDGTGIFSAGQILTKFGSSVHLGDLDGDGDLDALIIGINSGADNQVWLNDGKGNLTESIKVPTGLGYSDATLGDIDGDNDLDAFIGMSSLGSEEVWLNDGTGNFSKSRQKFDVPNEDSSKVALGDLDNDGDLDAVIHNHLFSDQIWLNDGKGDFFDSGQSLTHKPASFVFALGDINGDKTLDILAANTIWLNDGTAKFKRFNSLNVSATCPTALGDLDNDGDLDVFNGCIKGEGNQVWLNK